MPNATIVMVAPEMVQIAVVVDVKATARPDDAVADTVNGVEPNPFPASAAKVMVCAVNAADETAKDRVTCVAAL